MALIYGAYSGVEEFALDELQKMIQPLRALCGRNPPRSGAVDQDANHVLVGTVTNNPRIADLAQKSAFKTPTKRKATAAPASNPLERRKKAVVIAGTDAEGVLYGVIDFNKRLASATPDDPTEMRQALDNIAEFNAQESPLIENRGIWSWGYVIYDYRRFLDNMARSR